MFARDLQADAAEVRDERGTVEGIERQLVDGRGTVDEVERWIDVGAGVRSHDELADVRGVACAHAAPRSDRDGWVAGPRQHPVADRQGDVDDHGTSLVAWPPNWARRAAMSFIA